MDRIQRFLPVLKAYIKPDDETMKQLCDEFDERSKGKTYILLTDWQEQMRAEIMGPESRFKNSPQALKDKILERRFNAVAKRDENKDGKITKSEYVNMEYYYKLSAILDGEGDNYDGNLNQEEGTKFLETYCDLGVEKDFKALLTAFGDDTVDNIKTEDVIMGLYDLVRPSANVRMAKLVERVREEFTPPKTIRDRQTADFKKITKGRESITYADYRQFVRGSLKAMPYSKETREKMRDIINRRMMTFHNNDRNSDGTITLSEFVSCTSYIKIENSLINYDDNGDMQPSRAELVKWVSEKLRLDEDKYDYVDTLMQEFMEEGADQLRGGALVTGLFDRAFPTDTSRFNEIIDAVTKKYTLADEEKASTEKKFKAICGDQDFITMEAYEPIAREQLENDMKESGMPKKFWNIEGSLTTKMDGMRNLDRSKDGRISLTEYMLSTVNNNLMNSLLNEADGGDGKIDKKEMQKWLEHQLGFKEDLPLYASAIILAMREPGEESELDTWNFANRLYEVAFPSDDILVRRVVVAVRSNFALSEKDVEALTEEFKSLADATTGTIPKSVAADHIKQEVQMTYTEDLAKVILPKRLDGIDKADVNKDGQVSSEEWFRYEIFEKIFSSLHAHNTDGDLVMDRAELVAWLREKCQLTSGMYADACIGTFLGPQDNGNDHELKINDLMEKLFDMVLPTPQMRVDNVAKALKSSFGIGKKKDLLDRLKNAIRNPKGCTVEDVQWWLTEECKVDEDVEDKAKAIMEVAPTAMPTAIVNMLMKE